MHYEQYKQVAQTTPSTRLLRAGPFLFRANTVREEGTSIK